MRNFLKQFGGKVTKEWKAIYAQSPNWQNGSFQNLESTPLAGNIWDLPRIMYKQLSSRDGRAPELPLDIESFDEDAFLRDSSQSKFAWYGHSALLMRMHGKTIFIDPMLGPDTTPIAPTTGKRFSQNVLEIIDAIPEIDLIILTHDHYDHLDYASIQKLKNKTKQYFVALGVKRHLISWGVKPELIQEFDWWQSRTFANVNITFTPTRHFSGRGLTDRLKTLWGGWVFETKSEKIWFSGDGGYGKHFSEIGNRLGPFDFAFMECGQYNEDWRPIHLFPDEAVQAALDAKAQKIMPVHWAGFDLSYQHTWNEPPEVFVKSALDKNIDYALPPLGRIFTKDGALRDMWWTKYLS